MFAGLVDRENGFTTLAEATLEFVPGRIRFTEDGRSLYCGCSTITGIILFQLSVSVDALCNFSLDVIDFPLKPQESECYIVGGFLLGDLPSSEILGGSSDFVLNGQSLLWNEYLSPVIEMICRDKATESADVKYLALRSLAFSLTGEAIYMMVANADSIIRIMDWDVSNWKRKATLNARNFVKRRHILAVLRGGVLISTALFSCGTWSCHTASDNGAFMWCLCSPFQMTMCCVQYYQTLRRSSWILSLETLCQRLQSVLTSRLVVIRISICCIKLHQFGQSVPRWELSLPLPQFGRVLGCFSAKGQFIGSLLSRTCAYILDVFSRNVLFKLSDLDRLLDFKFISDEDIVILSYHSTRDASLRLFNVRSGDLLSVLRVYTSGERSFVATCPGEGLVAICSRFKFDLKVIKVKLSERRNASGMAKR